MRRESGAGIVDGFLWFLESRYKGRNKRSIATVTAVNYCSQVRHWIDWCQEHEFDYHKLDADGLAIYLGECRRRFKPNTVRHRLIAIRIFMDFLVSKGERPDNPAKDLPAPRVETPPTESFTPSELRRMYDACTSFRERAVFLLMLGSGLRRAEVFGIKKADVNWEQGTVTVLGKGGQYRMIAPGPMTLDVLEKAFEFDDRLCPYKWDIYVDNLVKRLAHSAGISSRVFPHKFRSHFASAFLDAGGTIEELQLVLGHSHFGMSLHYARAGRTKRALEAQRRIDVAGLALGDIVSAAG